MTILSKFFFSTKPPLPNFLAKSLFKDGDSYILYQSTEKYIFLFGNSFFLLYSGYYFYNYALNSEKVDLYMGAFMLSIFSLIYLRMHKTPKTIELLRDGKHVRLELFRLFGLFSEEFIVPTKGFHGHQVWGAGLLKKLNWPVANYKIGEKKKSMFFLTNYVKDEAILKKVFHGNEFRIQDDDMNINISNKMRQKYNM